MNTIRDQIRNLETRSKNAIYYFINMKIIFDAKIQINSYYHFLFLC